MKENKRVCSIFLLLVLALVLASCTDGAGQTSSVAGSEEPSVVSSAVSEESVIGTVFEESFDELKTQVPYNRVVEEADAAWTYDELYPDGDVPVDFGTSNWRVEPWWTREWGELLQGEFRKNFEVHDGKCV